MGRKQIVVLRALAKAKKPLTIQELADKGLKGDGRDENYASSDLRSAYRRLSARDLVKVSTEKRKVGKGDEAKDVEVQVAVITDKGKQALKDIDHPPAKPAKSAPAKPAKSKPAPAQAASEDESTGDAEDEGEGASEGDGAAVV